MESNNFPRVLQGQEICKLKSITGKVDFNIGSWGTKPNFQSAYFPFGDIHKDNQVNMFSSKQTTFLSDNVAFNTSTTLAANIRKEVNLSNEHKLQENITNAASLGATNINVANDNNVKGKVNSCKLFGFPLSGETSSQNTAKRSCTKVRDDNNKKIL
jgi:hypothetical protein